MAWSPNPDHVNKLYTIGDPRSVRFGNWWATVQMVWKLMMLSVVAGFIVATAFSLTLSVLDNGVGHTVVSLIHFVDP